VEMHAAGAFAACGSASLDPTFTFTWSVSGREGQIVLPPSRNPRSLRIPAFALAVGDYTVRLTGAARGLQNEATSKISVIPAPLVAVLEGGDRTVGFGDTIALSTASSFDPDTAVSHNGTGSAPLFTLWNCSVADGTSCFVNPANESEVLRDSVGGRLSFIDSHLPSGRADLDRPCHVAGRISSSGCL